jgi:hypothetical protein
MSDILSRLEMAVAENNGAAIINLVEFELMDAKGKTVIELPCEVGDTVYKYIDKLMQFKIIRVNTYHDDNGLRGLCQVEKVNKQCKIKGLCFKDDYIWFTFGEIGSTVFLTEQSATDVLERGKGNDGT